MSRRPSDSGFSLVEALVALAVFAMAGVGLLQLQTQSLRTLTSVETTALAGACAQNQMTEILASNDKPGIGVREEQARFAGRDWLVRIEIAATSTRQTRRASISVAPWGGGAGAVVHGFFTVPEAL